MKLHQYLEELKKMVEQDPSLLNLELYYSKDDEGNGYQMVGHTPSVYYTSEDLEYALDSAYYVEDIEEEILSDIPESDYDSKEECDKARLEHKETFKPFLLLN